MANEVNEDISFDYDENETIDDDEADSILSGESGKSNRKRNIPDITLYKLLTKKRRCIHFCFRKILMISFIPTLIYNLFWIIILKRIAFENLINFNFNNFKDYIIITCYIVLAKGIIILFMPQLFCGSEKNINDFSYICVILKGITSLIISIYLTHFMNKKLNFNNNSDNNEKMDNKNELQKYSNDFHHYYLILYN